MPTYSYRCTSCSHQFDIQQRFADEPLTVCPECGEALRKVFQPVGIVFKGSGGYINDSRASSKDNASSNGDASGKGDAPAEKATTPAKKDESASTKEAAVSTATDKAPAAAKVAAD